MKDYRKYILFLISGIFFLIAIFQEKLTQNINVSSELIEEFEKTLLNQEDEISDYILNIEMKISDTLSSRSYASTFSHLVDLYENKGFGFVIFKSNKMVYWSNNQIAFPNQILKNSGNGRLKILPNGIYTYQKRIVGNHIIYGLVHIKRNYSYENQFLQNTYIKPFKLPDDYQILASVDKKAVTVYDSNKQYLLSVLPTKKSFNSISKLIIPLSLYFLGFIFFLIALYFKLKEYPNENFSLKIFLLFLVLFILYWLHIIVGFPAILNSLDIFTAQNYAHSDWLPSLGDFILITILFFFWCLVFVKEYKIDRIKRKKQLFISLVFAGLLYQVAGLMIVNLVQNSNVSFKLNRITDIDIFSFICYLAVALWLFSAFLVHLKTLEKASLLTSKKTFIRINLVLGIISILLILIFESQSLFALVLFFAVTLLQFIAEKFNLNRFSLPYAILFISLFSAFSLVLIYSTIKKRDIEVQKLYAITLSSEQDPVAEVYLSRMLMPFNTDSIIPTLLTPPFKELESYLNRTYFSGYFRKYDIQYTICTGTDSLLVQPENIFEPCFPFFDKMIANSHGKIPGSNYYLNSHAGRLSYIGKMYYPIAEIQGGISIFIEINSKIISEGIGFPELLMDKSLIKPFRYKYLSYAKYFEDELVNKSGEYNYNLYLKAYNLSDSNKEFNLVEFDGYDHLIYKVNENSIILVSNKSINFIDYLISFPYIFVFYFIIVLSIVFVGNPGFRKLIIPQDLRFRIQVSIILVVLISLLLVASGTIYYNIKEYRNRHQNDLQEKMKSISEEIKYRLMYVNSITPELQQWLYRELYKLSNIFRTDINIYDVNGLLIATSRPEIFAKGLTSERMNSEAFHELSERFQLNYFHPEKIGNLTYLSSYEPIINNQREYLGYLNLPYFTREDDLKQGISTFVVAFINLYLLLFLSSVIIAVILSNKITQPLTLVREKIRSIQLGKKNEHINYQARDEIGSLVREYNHKVDELAESADLLAKSERESAWREMAKQIAHEIKNPLTPMKLNIQYLQRAKQEGNEHYDDFFERVTKNLIEQIDTLSGIATEFSNFAQIPQTKNETFNLVEVIVNVISLFEPNKNLNVSFKKGNSKEVLVFADKEQLSRAFLNLLKNAIQSVPQTKKGLVEVNLETSDNYCIVAIKDNGSGISDDAREYLFEPNFTTKSSGMGLGLSIVKSILDNCGGKISYETKINEGSTFFVEIPILTA